MLPRLTLITALVIVATVPARAEEPKALDALVANLVGDDQPTRYAAYRELLQRKDRAVIPLLVKAIPDTSTMSQYYGAYVIERFDPKFTRAAFRKLATAPSAHMRVLAGSALHRMGERDAADIVAKALDPNVPAAELTHAVIRAWGVRDPKVNEAARMLITLDEDASVLDAVLYRVYLVRDEGALEAIEALLGSDDPNVRVLASACLLSLGRVEHAQALAQALADATGDIPNLYRLKLYLDRAKPVPIVVLDALVGRMGDETNTSALHTLMAIFKEQQSPRAIPALRKLLGHEDAAIASAAFAALSAFPNAISEDDYREQLEAGTDSMRLAAADALRKIDDFSGLPAVLAILKEGKSELDRREAAKVAGTFRSAQVIEPLLDALMAPSSMVRMYAAGGLIGTLQTLFPHRKFDIASTGYVYSSSEATRKSGVAQIRAWWQKHKDSAW